MRWSLPGESLAARRRGGRAGVRSPSGYCNTSQKCRICKRSVPTTDLAARANGGTTQKGRKTHAQSRTVGPARR
eukprot:6599948-Prymnesium_polylepis.1